MNTFLQVAAGGAIGATLRFGVVQAVVRGFGVGTPVGTLFVNVAGSFLMGLIAAWMVHHMEEARFSPFLMTGILGGFTTFSAFSLDTVLLWEQGRQGLAAAYVFGSVICAVGALLAGLLVMRAVLS